MMTKQRHYLEPSDLLTYNLAVSDAGIAMFGYSRGILEVFNVLNDEGQLIRTLWTCQVGCRSRDLDSLSKTFFDVVS